MISRDEDGKIPQLKVEKYDRFYPYVTIKEVSGIPDKILSEAKAVGGGDIWIQAVDQLQTFVMESALKKFDTMKMTFIDDEGSFTDPNKLILGVVIDVSWGYHGRISETRRLIVKRMQIGMLQGRKYARRRRGFLVTLEGIAPVLARSKTVDLVDDTFEGKTVSYICTQLAQKLGYYVGAKSDKRFTVNIPPEMDIEFPPNTRPMNVTILSYLVHIANQAGLYVRQTPSEGLYVGVETTKNKTIHTIDMDGDHLLGFDLEGDLIVGIPAGITVASYDPKSNKTSYTRTTQEKSAMPRQPLLNKAYRLLWLTRACSLLLAWT